MRLSEDLPLDPEVVAELEVIDATLAGEIVDPMHAELAELSLLLAADRPPMPEPAAARLDARVAQRFAFTATQAPTPRRRRLPAWALRPGFGVAGAALAAAVVVVAVVGIPGGGSSSSSDLNLTPALHRGADLNSSSKSSSSASASSGASFGAGSTASSAAAPLARRAAKPGTNGAIAAATPYLGPVGNGRRMTQSAALQLLAPGPRIDAVAQELFDAVGQEQGIVNNSTITAAAGNGGYASFSLSIPSANLATTMTRLSQLRYAHVASRTDATQDVNNQYLSDVRRLADARALRTSLLKQLAAATTTAAVTSLQAQIHDAEASISSDEATLAGLQHRISYSTLTVQIDAASLPAPVTRGAGGSSSGFTLGRAVHDAGRVLVVAAGVILIALAALLPVALLAALAAWVARRLRARQREQTLDAT